MSRLPFRLDPGDHSLDESGYLCVNEAAIVAAGLEFNSVQETDDLPRCFSQVLGGFLLEVNDAAGSRAVRHQILESYVRRMYASRGTAAQERLRLVVFAKALAARLLLPKVRKRLRLEKLGEGECQVYRERIEKAVTLNEVARILVVLDCTPGFGCLSAARSGTPMPVRWHGTAAREIGAEYMRTEPSVREVRKLLKLAAASGPMGAPLPTRTIVRNWRRAIEADD